LKYLQRVDELDPGVADGLGRRQHLKFTTRLPYRLGFDIATVVGARRIVDGETVIDPTIV